MAILAGLLPALVVFAQSGGVPAATPSGEQPQPAESPAPQSRPPASAIPEPAELAPEVRFWVRVYTEIATNEGFIHDERNLAVVYERMRFADGISPRQRQAGVDAERDRLVAILRRLASGAAPANEREQRIKNLWGEAGSPERLRQAALEIRFQLGQSDRFRAGLERSWRWQPHIAETFANRGLPPELAVLPHVESSFNPDAYSKVGAAGLWQFMRSTGRLYMRVDNAVDERLDPYRSTEAAAQLLSHNYRVLGTWPLALTAYNHGAAGMRRAVQQTGSDDIVRIIRTHRSPSFGFASRNFYVSFLAALTIHRDQERYFPGLQRAGAVKYAEVALTAPANASAVERALGVERAVLRSVNPALRSAVWNGQRPIPKGYRLRLPAGVNVSDEQFLARLGAPPAPPPRAPRPLIAAGTVTSPTGDSASAVGFYTVRRGDSISRIALRTGVRAAELLQLNELRDTDHIYEGQRLRLRAIIEPEGEVAARQIASESTAIAERRAEARVVEAAARAPLAAPVTSTQAAEQGPSLVPGAYPAADLDPIDYSVAANDSIAVAAAETLGHYADWLGLSATRLRTLNGFSTRTPVVIGRRIKLEFSRVARAAFEDKRRAYHQRLQAEYFAVNQLSGTALRKTAPGDSLWALTQQAQVPVWLLQQYNPDVNFADLRAGMELVIPRVVARP